jgi:transcription-repair coupling factor (superfamily II helicase)
MQHWLKFFGQESFKLALPEVEGGINTEYLHRLLIFLGGDKHNSPPILLITRESWEQEFPSLHDLTERSLVVKKGETTPFTRLVEDLLDRGYTHSDDEYLTPGQYRRAGEILEIFPIQAKAPVRAVFDVDRIERLESLDPTDRGKTTDAGASVDILPVKFASLKKLEKQLPKDTLVVLDDQDDLGAVKGADTLAFTSFPQSEAPHVHLRYLSVLKFYTLTDFLNDVRDKLQQGWTLIIVTKRGEELAGILKEEHVPFTEELIRRPGAITLIPAGDEALLPHSLQNPDLKCALITDREVFSLKKGSKQRSIQKLALDFITSLAPGDFVVHMEHGIGRFEGVTQKIVDNTVREYLELHYAEGDKLFVPVDQADKLSKHVHEEGQEPVLTRLGSSEWKRVTERIKEETERVAKEFLALYAKRSASKRPVYDEDTKEQKAFEDAFPYEETPGQRKAIEDLKRDMESVHPMDRLVCGDVGFGKTEVAMRAAFKAVQSGRQVALVTPITILADQHYHTMLERMKGFPVRVEMLSRFRKAAEQKKIIEKVRKGDIDILVGTHRLLQPDVKFHNLGVVIIDEEQRFGVKQKETFKELRANIDILTLTATPIPRTLHLGLHKLRDISTITTPPPGRLPIITEVRKYSDELVRQAVLTEIKRSGQCFVLHNRVETIDAFAGKLKSLIPDATFIVAHGQLDPEELEKRIVAFKEGKYTVLVSSTIIENGIDLPRANTLIVNEADRFGLAQLYQLRGRVGRGKVQAYAYFLYSSQKLSEEAKKRLRAIVEACELGSGFQVAMRDLEIRGSGEILGVNQAGTMQTVGVSHYLRMLKNAVEELKAGRREEIEEIENVEILLPVEALIPSYYIPDATERIAVYQKLAGSDDEAILKEFEDDLRDEYGELPEEVQHLFAVLRLKLTCRRSGVLRVKSEEGTRREIVLSLSSRVTAKEIMQLLQKNSQWRISSSTLRIAEDELKKHSKGGDGWIGMLREDIVHLQRRRKKAAEQNT